MTDKMPITQSIEESKHASPKKPLERVPRFAYWALFLLTLANVLNYLDRKLLSILANAIKEDLGISDAQIGFLYGTVFAALYAIVGLPMGRLADRWVRTRLMGLGVAPRSTMTALSGFATNLSQLSLARIGVSVGESVANPTSHSLIADYFPVHRRASAFATYLAGVFIGAGLSMILGGLIIQSWDDIAVFLGIGGLLKPWQAAFLVCGVPGLFVAFLLTKMKEPKRGAFEHEPNKQPTNEPHPWKNFVSDVLTVLPPTSFFKLYRFSAQALRWNLLAATIIALIACTLILLTHDTEQWIAVGLAAYAVCSFAQMLKINDPVLFRLTFGGRAFQLLVVGMSATAAINHSIAFWATPYMLRRFNLPIDEAGLAMGAIMIIASGLGVIGGGIIVDRLRKCYQSAAALMTIFTLLLSMPFAIGAFLTSDLTTFYICFSIFALVQNGWSGGAAAVLQEIVLPRMRATASAAYSLLMLTTGFAIGPYAVGKISSLTDSLAIGALSLYVLAPLGLIALIFATRAVPEAIQNKQLHAAEAGEVMESK